MNDRDSFLDEVLEHASHERRHHLADALACHLHNEGYQLEGNTEANDVEWLARNLYEHPSANRSWENAHPDNRTDMRRVARRVLEVLPDYQLRVAHRLITLSKVVRDIERAERIQLKRQTEAKP